MSDFHIVALKYRLQLSDHLSYAEPPPVVFETEAARFHLENNKLRCDMKLHAATSEQVIRNIESIFSLS